MAVSSAITTAELVRSKELSAVAATTEALARVEHANETLNAFVHIDAELALEAAAAVDATVAAGEDPGPLAGIPFGVKDNMDCKGMPTGHGSVLYKDGPPKSADDPFIARLRAAGAIPIGKTAMPEFGLSSLTESPGWGVTRNPWDPRLTPGGSSGGTAASVSSGMVPFGTGSDVGGSIRAPAAYTGLVGLMPTHGRVPFPQSIEMDTLGVLARTAADSARIFDVTAGFGPPTGTLSSPILRTARRRWSRWTARACARAGPPTSASPRSRARWSTWA